MFWGLFGSTKKACKKVVKKPTVGKKTVGKKVVKKTTVGKKHKIAKKTKTVKKTVGKKHKVKRGGAVRSGSVVQGRIRP